MDKHEEASFQVWGNWRTYNLPLMTDQGWKAAQAVAVGVRQETIKVLMTGVRHTSYSHEWKKEITDG